MTRKLTDEKTSAVLADRKLPFRDNARRNKVSLGFVQKTLAAAPEPEVSVPAVAPPANDLDDAIALGEQALTGTNLEELRASAERIKRASLATTAEGDWARTISAERVYGQSLAKIDQLERQAAADKKDPSEHPDMVALAQRYREGMRRDLDRILAELAPK